MFQTRELVREMSEEMEQGMREGEEAESMPVSLRKVGKKIV